MNEELILRLLQIVNVIVCMLMIFVVLWVYVGKKKVDAITLLFSLTLVTLLLVKILDLMPYDEVIILLCLLMVFYLQLKKLNDSINRVSVDHRLSNEKMQSIQLRAQEQERSRIYANLHDDVGAQLLQLIYSTKDDESRLIAKNVLNEMRKAVASTQNIQLNMSQLVQDIFDESQSRLNAAEIDVVVQSNIYDDDHKLSLIAPNIICRIMREVISNVIKHAKASQVKLSVDSTATHLHVTVIDNGKGFAGDKSQGKGLKTIKKRAESISADVHWQSQDQRGCTFNLSYQL